MARSEPPDRRALGPGDRVGRYVVEALLGAGGMGAVYLAHDDVLRRKVALKIVRGGRGEDDARRARRVLREARMAAALDHPNVVALFDFGEHAGDAFLVMERVVGAPLRAFVGAPEPPVATRVEWLVDVARALAAAHAAGLVHRDIKPENVMIRNDGVVKVLDFGIAAPVGGARHPTEPALMGPQAALSPGPRTDPSREAGAAEMLATTEATVGISGTPPYMAPETFTRLASDGATPPSPATEAAADQFAWGVVAYELLVGKRPWTDESTIERTLRSVREDQPPPLTSLVPGVPPAFAAAVERALAKRPEERFGSMAALLRALGVAGVTAPPPTAVSSYAPTVPASISAAQLDTALLDRAGDAAARRPRSPAAIAGLFIAGLGLAGALGLAAMRVAHVVRTSSAAPALRLTHQERVLLETTCNEFPSWTPDGEHVVFDGVNGPDSHVYELDVGTRQAKPLTSGKGWQYAASASPDGRWIAYLAGAEDEKVLMLAPRDGSAAPRSIGTPGVPPSWSARGDGLWCGDGTKATRIDPTSGAVERALTPPPGLVFLHVLELANGTAVAILGESAQYSGTALAIYEKGAGAPTIRLREDLDETLTLLPGDRAVGVASLGRANGATLLGVPIDGGAVEPIAFTNAPTRGMSLSQKGDRAAWSTCTQRSALARVAAAPAEGVLEARAIALPPSWGGTEPAPVAGTSLVVVASARRYAHNTPWVLDLAGATPPRELPSVGGDIVSPAVSPGGHAVAFVGAKGELYVEPFDGSAEPRRLAGAAPAQSPSFSHDDRVVFFAHTGEDSLPSIFAIELPDGAPKAVLGRGYWGPAASPADGRLLVFQRSDDSHSAPRIYEPATATLSPLADGLDDKAWTGGCFSEDGRRAVVFSSQLAVEVDLASRRVLRRLESGAVTFQRFLYSQGDLVVNRVAWEGDLWLGDVER